MAETPEQLIGYAKWKLKELRERIKFSGGLAEDDALIQSRIHFYESFLESHGVEVEKDG